MDTRHIAAAYPPHYKLRIDHECIYDIYHGWTPYIHSMSNKYTPFISRNYRVSIAATYPRHTRQTPTTLLSEHATTAAPLVPWQSVLWLSSSVTCARHRTPPSAYAPQCTGRTPRHVSGLGSTQMWILSRFAGAVHEVRVEAEFLDSFPMSRPLIITGTHGQITSTSYTHVLSRSDISSALAGFLQQPMIQVRVSPCPQWLNIPRRDLMLWDRNC